MTLFGPGTRADDRPADIAALVQVAIERGVDRYPDGLTYALPLALADVRVGERVAVPLGKGDATVAGTVVRRMDLALDAPPRGRLKFVESRLGDATPLPEGLIELAHWISAYYACPIGVTLAGMVPAAVKRGVGSRTRQLVRLADDWRERLAAAGRATPKQRAIVAALESAAPDELPMEERDVARLAGLASPAAVRRLVHAGVLAAERRTQVEAQWRHDRALATPRPELTHEQATVVQAVGAAIGHGFSQHLLFGVTGSGKTEVYLRLIERTIALGKVALLLVPEISLTPQTGGRLLARFPKAHVAILHSGLTAAQRHQQWAQVADGRVQIVMGARSAVLAPTPEGALGLVVVDEEHDTSYKQDQQPRYHGRDVAIRRAQVAGCPVLLGSATPSLESWFNATERGTSTLHTLRSRAPGLSLPTVQVVDFAEERRRFPDHRVHLLGPTLAAGVQHTLAEGGQVLILLNRRGYANYIACSDQRCGWMMRCDHCDAGMICHRLGAQGSLPSAEFVRCHHCGTEQRLPRDCPQCGRGVTVFGFGVQRVEDELQRLDASLVAGKTLLRLDADTMHTAAHFHDALGAFARGDARVLVGTQMIAKGLDFAGVRLVGVVNADTALNLPDFRAAERTFQLVSQVSGRCGRGASAGRAIVQTFQPQSPAVRLAAEHRFEDFAREELALRRSFGLPPWRRMVRFVVRDADEETARAQSEDLVRALAALPESQGVDLRGPSPCPIARIADRWRMQVEAFADTPAPLQRLLAAGRSAGVVRPSDRLAVDMDPVALM